MHGPQEDIHDFLARQDPCISTRADMLLQMLAPDVRRDVLDLAIKQARKDLRTTVSVNHVQEAWISISKGNQKHDLEKARAAKTTAHNKERWRMRREIA